MKGHLWRELEAGGLLSISAALKFRAAGTRWWLLQCRSRAEPGEHRGAGGAGPHSQLCHQRVMSLLGPRVTVALLSTQRAS